MDGHIAFFIFTTASCFEPMSETLANVLFSQIGPLRPKRISMLGGNMVAADPSSLRNHLSTKSSGRSMLIECGAGNAIQFHWRTPSKFSVVSGTINGDSTTDTATQSLIRIVKELVVAVDAVYGELRNSKDSGMKPFDLMHRLPDVPNILILGRQYVSMFGESKLLSAPVSSVERLSGGHYWLSVDSDLGTPVDEEKKQQVRMYLGVDAFMAEGQYRYKTGTAPIFEFG